MLRNEDRFMGVDFAEKSYLATGTSTMPPIIIKNKPNKKKKERKQKTFLRKHGMKIAIVLMAFIWLIIVYKTL